jgi:hypothetical protein
MSSHTVLRRTRLKDQPTLEMLAAAAAAGVSRSTVSR